MSLGGHSFDPVRAISDGQSLAKEVGVLCHENPYSVPPAVEGDLKNVLFWGLFSWTYFGLVVLHGHNRRMVSTSRPRAMTATWLQLMRALLYCLHSGSRNSAVNAMMAYLIWCRGVGLWAAYIIFIPQSFMMWFILHVSIKCCCCRGTQKFANYYRWSVSVKHIVDVFHKTIEWFLPVLQPGVLDGPAPQGLSHALFREKKNDSRWRTCDWLGNGSERWFCWSRFYCPKWSILQIYAGKWKDVWNQIWSSVGTNKKTIIFVIFKS